MAAMKEFAAWFLSQLPSFFMSEPICYIVGVAFLGLAIMMFKRIISR